MDVLEMNYSKDRRALSAIKRKLLARPIKDSNLYPVSSFMLEDALVVIQERPQKQVREFYLLNAHKGSFETFGVSPNSL